MSGGKGSGTTGMWIALGGYTFLFVIKLAAYFYTHIGVMFAEAMHSTADMLIVGFLLVATYLSKKPADSEYRFGYGRAQNIAALVAATIFISFTSFETLREAIPKLWAVPEEMSGYTLAIGVLVLSVVVSGLPLITLLRNKKRSAAEKAQLIEVVNDELALVAALVGIVLVSMGLPLADPIASIVVALVIAANAIILWRENAAGLMGRSPDDAFYEMVRETAMSVPGVLATHSVIAERVGEQTHLGMHVEVAGGTLIEDADRMADAVVALISGKVEDIYVVVHADPANAQHGPE
jgi:cation diffusion facilitator family transporter